MYAHKSLICNTLAPFYEQNTYGICNTYQKYTKYT
jgi:hypothetical protein